MKKLLLMLLTVVMLVGSIPMPFSEAKADRAVHFFEQLKHTDGDFYDKPFILLPWEKKIIRDVYGTVNEDGTRQYKFVYIEVPKKNGKSELGAGAALYHLFADGERNGEIYGCAADRKQAAIVYKVAKRMVEMTPALQKRSKIRDSSKTITDKISGSVYEVLSAESFTKHGFKTSACIFDELHAQPNRDLWDVMTFEAGATRRQPLWWVITTAGDDPDRASIGWEIHEYAIKIASGEYTDPAWYVVIYSYDGDDIYNEVNWHLANPSLGTTKSLKSMREAAITAKNKPADERLFRWLDLNQWITSKLTTWLPLDLYDQTVGDWDECDQEGKDCYIGLDLSTTTDLSAISPIFPPQGTQLDWRVLWDTWIPKENMVERIARDHVDYDNWSKNGWITPTDGNVVDYVAIRERILELSKRYKIVEVVADPAFAAMLLQELQDAGLNVVTVPQTFVNLTDPMNQVETLLKSGKMTHLADPVARWAFGNTSIAKNGSGLIKYVKETRGKSVIRTKRIDPMAAMITAMCRARFYKGRVDMSAEILSDDWGM